MPTETIKPSQCCVLAPLVMPPKKKRGCLWHLTGERRSRESSIQSASSRQNLSGLERARQEVACCGATKVEQRGCNHRARKELTSSAAVVCHTLKITYSVSTTSKATYESTSCWDALVPVPKETCPFFFSFCLRKKCIFLSRTSTSSAQLYPRANLSQAGNPAAKTCTCNTPSTNIPTPNLSCAVGAGVSNVQSATLNTTQQESRAVADLFCTVGWAVVQHVVKQRMSLKQRNKQDRWELKVPPRSPL